MEDTSDELSSWQEELFGLATGVSMQNHVGREKAHTVQFVGQVDSVRGAIIPGTGHNRTTSSPCGTESKANLCPLVHPTSGF